MQSENFINETRDRTWGSRGRGLWLLGGLGERKQAGGRRCGLFEQYLELRIMVWRWLQAAGLLVTLACGGVPKAAENPERWFWTRFGASTTLLTTYADVASKPANLLRDATRLRARYGPPPGSYISFGSGVHLVYLELAFHICDCSQRL